MTIVTIGWAIAGIGFSSLLFVVVSGYKNKIQDDIKEYKLITSSGCAAPHKSEQQNSIYREGKIIANTAMDSDQSEEHSRQSLNYWNTSTTDTPMLWISTLRNSLTMYRRTN